MPLRSLVTGPRHPSAWPGTVQASNDLTPTDPVIIMPNTRRKVFAFGLDAPNNHLLLDWQQRGLLPNLAGLCERSAIARISHTKTFSNEHSWIPFLTGVAQDRWNHWLSQWDPATYGYSEASLYNWEDAPVFYALGDARKIATFDLSAPISRGVNGIQVIGWATDLNESFPASQPEELIGELVARYGQDPKTRDAPETSNRLTGKKGFSYRIPSIYDPGAARDFRDMLIESAERRVQICLDLMQRDAWDLFIALFSEPHTAGHVLWHMDQPHPLAQAQEGQTPAALLPVYQAVDRALGELVSAVDDDAYVLFFTIDTMEVDCLENARSVFLPEFLYRWCFGHPALATGITDQPPPPIRLDYREHWKHELWQLRTPQGEAALESPAAQEARKDPLSWCPATWYAGCWPRMRAFALPSVADGYVRVNVEGREANGIVAPKDYDDVCAELARDLSSLVNARTGRPMVREILRVRSDPFDDDPKKPPADLIVIWQEQEPPDVVDSPLIGRIGPLPYFRSGSHPSQGTALHNLVYLSGPGIPAGQQLPDGRPEDIPATILDLMGLERPAHYDGVTLIDPEFLVRGTERV
jgi:hypothetical protein